MVTDHHRTTFFVFAGALVAPSCPLGAEFLQHLQFDWEYKLGRVNVADPLSRRLPCFVRHGPFWQFRQGCIASRRARRWRLRVRLPSRLTSLRSPCIRLAMVPCGHRTISHCSVSCLFTYCTVSCLFTYCIFSSSGTFGHVTARHTGTISTPFKVRCLLATSLWRHWHPFKGK